MTQPRRIVLLTLLAAVLLCAPTLAQSVNVVGGVSPRGAWYTIAVPATWNGGLVFYNHGFSLTPETGPPDLGPLQELQILEGYAIAASGYSQVGWAVFKSDDDLEELYDIFVGNFGTPAQVFVYGPSLGGAVTARAIEQAQIGNVVGALPFCGAVGGSRNWDAGVDVRLLYDAICGNVPGAAIPGGANGLPFPPMLTPTDTITAINICMGQDLPQRTPAQQARLDRFLAVTQIPQSFISTSLGFFATFGMADLVYDPEKMGGAIGTGNRNVDYGNALINATIPRVGARPAARQRLRKNYTPTGRVGNVKIVSIHTDKDGLILLENESMYASVVPRSRLTVGVVQEAVPTHCGFTSAELVAAWEALRGWVAGDPQPSPYTLAVLCGAFEPVFGGPCRYNPFYPLPDPDVRFRPRNPASAQRASQVKASAAPGSAAPQAPPAAPEQLAPAARVEPTPTAPTRTLDRTFGIDQLPVGKTLPRSLNRRED